MTALAKQTKEGVMMCMAYIAREQMGNPTVLCRFVIHPRHSPSGK